MERTIGISGEAAKAELYGEIREQDEPRIVTANVEFDRVLGGGLVPGSVVLLGGEPGIGKSTLLLQISETLAARGLSVLYVSGEESPRQIKLRGDRLGVSGKGLYLLAETCLEKIQQEIERIRPGCIVLDSVQTVYSSRVESAPGTVSQVKEVARSFYIMRKPMTCRLCSLDTSPKRELWRVPRRWSTLLTSFFILKVIVIRATSWCGR
ncbi:MAG TPA: ATPase domain-containing protein [Acidobacteriota bacterium]|jgi:DNA repair protein RadA/Sms|nr:ATPase domain-containing protein [Acidobacteriota bacterium]